MDSEHRHELKTNELAAWIEHFPGFCKKNGSQIIGALLIIAAIISYFVFKSSSKQSGLKQQAETTSQIQMVKNNKVEVYMGVISSAPIESTGFEATAKALENAAEEAKEPHFAALALIKRGEALRSELHYTAGKVEQGTIASQIAIAKEAYTKALEKAKGNNTLSAMATFGLGLCEEEIGDFEKAAEVYSGIVNNADFKGTIFPTQAQYRLDIMSDHEKQFTFIAAPTPVINIPAGFDKSAAEALEKGQIYMENAPKAPATPKAPAAEKVEIPEVQQEIMGPIQPMEDSDTAETDSEQK